MDYVYTGRNEFRGMHHNDLLNLSELQKEQILEIALKALISQGMSESQARKTLGIDT